MNPPQYPAGGNRPSPPKKELQLQGTRPAPLKVSKDSHKIKKLPPPPPAPPAKPPLPPATHHRQPVIIYSVSPKVIHATVNDFMTVVQRLTGPSPTAAGDLSPAARFASIEKTSPSERGRSSAAAAAAASELMDLVEGVEVGRVPGILSPAPGNFPPIPAGFFSPASDPNMLSFLQDLSPFWQGNGSGGFTASPSGLFSAPIVSPTPSIDLFNLFLDF